MKCEHLPCADKNGSIAKELFCMLLLPAHRDQKNEEDQLGLCGH